MSIKDNSPRQSVLRADRYTLQEHGMSAVDLAQEMLSDTALDDYWRDRARLFLAQVTT